MIEKSRWIGTSSCATPLLFVVLLDLLWFATLVSGSVGPRDGFADFRFTDEPSDTVARKNGSAMLHCQVNARGSAKVEWRREDLVLTPVQDPRRSVLANGSLYFSHIVHSRTQRPDEGVYQCVASLDGVGTIVSRSAKLQVSALTRFDVEPSNVSVLEGQTARFPCSIQGIPPPTITWLKDNRPLLLDETRMLVLTSGSLEVDAVTVQDSGSYRCNASNKEQFKLSRAGLLRVNIETSSVWTISAPSFIAQPSGLVVAAGESVTLDCAANGNPRPTITWLKDGTTIDLSYLDSRFHRVGVGSLHISDVREEDDGTYQCRAENKEDSTDSTAIVEVQVAPRVVKQPQNTYAREKEDVELECEIYGRPEPTVTWTKNGDVIVDTGYFRIVNGKNLRILGVIAQDAGMYQCFGKNPAGNVQASAQLKVLGPDTSPHPLLTPSPYNDAPGSVSPTKDVPSEPRDVRTPFVSKRFVTLTWTEPVKTNGPIFSYSVFYRQEGSDRERVVNTTRARLEEANIQGLVPGQRYLFRVVARNQHGPGQSSEEVGVTTQTEVDVPGTPSGLRAMPLSPTSVRVSWSGAESSYRLYYMKVGSTEEHEAMVTGNTFDLTSLEEFTTYDVWVAAVDESGVGGVSTGQVSVRTYSDVPSATPQNVTVEASSSSSIRVSWDPPALDHQNGVITGYKIRFKRRGMKRGMTKTTDGSRRVYALAGLERGAEYSVKMSALTVNGSGPTTEWMQARTYHTDLDETKIPDSPSSLKARAMTNSITVMWSPPRNQNIMVRGYTIGWGKGVPDSYTKLVNANQRHYVIENLQANAEYVISLRASNSIGDGQPIYETVRTRESTTPEPLSPLVPPVGLKALVLSASTIIVHWTDTSLPRNQHKAESDSRYYIVRYTTYSTTNLRYRYYNSTDLNCMIDNLRPNTQYEFSVKLVKGRRESPWSLVVENTTHEAAPGSAPRDLTVVESDNGDPTTIILNWQPPRQPNGQITGYVIFYTTNERLRDRDWVFDGVVGDKMSMVIKRLTPDTTYYFKIQARTSKGYGPLSNTVTYTTGEGVPLPPPDRGGGNNTTLYIIIGVAVAVVVLMSTCVTAILCRRRRSAAAAAGDRSKKGYVKGSKTKATKPDLKPPDLWIHHDQMELRALEKRSANPQSCHGDGSGSTPRSSQEYSSSTLDRRIYGSSYMGKDTSKSEERLDRSIQRRSFKPKPIMIPVDSQPPKEPVATALPVPNGTLNQLSDVNRPTYSRTHPTHAHVTVDAPPPAYGATVSDDSSTMGSGVPATSHGHPPGEYQSEGNTGSLGKRPQGHPLRSFSVPAPPPPTTSAPTTPQPKHIARPVTASPFKKGGPLTSTPTSLTKNRSSGVALGSPRPPEASREELVPLKPSYSTEELNQEMANLEGLMKDLNAITASEFKC